MYWWVMGGLCIGTDGQFDKFRVAAAAGCGCPDHLVQGQWRWVWWSRDNNDTIIMVKAESAPLL